MFPIGCTRKTDMEKKHGCHCLGEMAVHVHNILASGGVGVKVCTLLSDY